MDESDDGIELLEQRELTSVPPEFVARFFGRIAVELHASFDVPGDPQARRFPLEVVDVGVMCLVVRVDVRGNDATVELTLETFADDPSLAAALASGSPDRARLVATLWRAAQQAARTDPLPS